MKRVCDCITASAFISNFSMTSFFYVYEGITRDLLASIDIVN